MRPKLADSYVPSVYAELLGAGGGQSVGSGTWPTANKAIYIPVTFPYPCQLYSLAFIANNGTGNYDLGLYDGYSKNKIQSTGSTAMSAAGAKKLTFSPEVRADPGKLYYMALALSSASGTAARNASAIAPLIAIGCAEQLTALPLPSSMTPVTTSSAYMPVFVFGIR